MLFNNFNNFHNVFRLGLIIILVLFTSCSTSRKVTYEASHWEASSVEGGQLSCKVAEVKGGSVTLRRIYIYDDTPERKIKAYIEERDSTFASADIRDTTSIQTIEKKIAIDNTEKSRSSADFSGIAITLVLLIVVFILVRICIEKR